MKAKEIMELVDEVALNLDGNRVAARAKLQAFADEFESIKNLMPKTSRMGGDQYSQWSKGK